MAEASVKPFTITHSFNAPRDLVFKVWTQKEHLEKWMSPVGFDMKVVRAEFKPGGVVHYVQSTPDGKQMWGKWTIREINPPERIVLVSSFSDEKGGITRHPMSATWPQETLSTTTFTEKDGKTVMTLEWLPLNANAEELKTFDSAREGMNGGWKGTLAQLDAYLATQTR